MITPTIGRQVWYRPFAGDPTYDQNAYQRLAATVCKVWSDTMVNLLVIAEDGHTFIRTSVVLCQDGYIPQMGQCEWMPYQRKAAEAGRA